jgi:hypothetical protein
MKKHVHEMRGITFAEYGALLGVCEMLKNGTLNPTTKRSPAELVKGRHGFNMHVPGCATECASVGCIGGTMALIMGQIPYDYVGFSCQHTAPHSETLDELFFPPDDSTPDPWAWIKPAVAVKAIDNWLRTGKPGWAKLKKASQS